jgi:hypothetical protein
MHISPYSLSVLLLSPSSWQSFYFHLTDVCVCFLVFEGMLDYLSAPCPYIIGMHRSLFSDQISLSGVLIVDLDYGTLRYAPDDVTTVAVADSSEQTDGKKSSGFETLPISFSLFLFPSLSLSLSPALSLSHPLIPFSSATAFSSITQRFSRL